jgi:hypothetical protein
MSCSAGPLSLPLDFRSLPGALWNWGLARRVEYSTISVQDVSRLAEDFFDRILEMDLNSDRITDRLSVWEFPDTEDEAAVFAKIRAAYGVDVPDIRSGNLAQIF